ncbi:MAG: hypothetical protein CMP76_17195 [Flavobacterium sp.]|uniref:terminase large subunit n=1 Tax=Flavobacterium sp. TaxID=239 RepID=UPI000C492EE5|nr:terminase TerL endonuclease subunit [Flavobacterium sp.]MBF05015.1 hypothetical protein [Flavobacterium sp.]|tara:strand:- start:2677 stop:4386 length:1710 start_codon:yes stop_codon:yes gene_type:complete
MKLTAKHKNNPAFQYAAAVKAGKIKTGKKVQQAVDRFYQWVADAEKDGYYLDFDAGMKAVEFFPTFLNHTIGELAGKPFLLAPFQQFTIFNLFAWKDLQGNRRINTVYDKRAKKNGKTAEMAGLALYCMSFDMEMSAQIYVGATKEAQAKLCWNQAKDFIESPVANFNLRKMGFYTRQSIIHFGPTKSTMMPLGGDSKTQDGINSHLSIIDEYHAHPTDGVKENLESSSVNRRNPITYHITTAGTNIASVCKNYEDSVIEVLEGRKIDHSLWVMIHDLDEGDDWEDHNNWYKANPLLGQGLKIENIVKEYTKAKNQPSKVPNFKTKHLNMWVDAPVIWIPNEIWKRNKVGEITLNHFKEFRCYAALDLSTTTDITAFVAVSEPNNKHERFILPFFFCPEDTIERRSKEDRVPYRYWKDAGYLIATPGEVVDYNIIEDFIKQKFPELNIIRLEVDRWNATPLVNNLMEDNYEVSYFSQTITNMSSPTKTFEKLVYEGNLKHDGNPVLEWMLSGCVIIADANENVKVHKGRSNKHGKRVDGIIAAIMALGGSLSPKEEVSKYSKPTNDIYI